MATEQPDRFDRVDWEEFADSRGISLSINSKLMLAATIPLLALAFYDWRFVGERKATFEELGQDLNLSWLFETVGLNQDLSSVDYLFLFTLLLFFLYLVLPLYQNPRMTKYYWSEFKRNRPAVVSLVWLGIIFVGGLLGPFFISAPEQDILAGFQPPVFASVDSVYVSQCLGEMANGRCYGTWEYPLGTTRAGEGVFAGIVHGMTISMQIAFITTTIVAVIGITFGTVSAYSGGWIDEVMMRFVDIVISFPTFVMFLLILYIYGASLGMFILIFSVFGWGTTARYVRSKALSISEEEYIKANRISGASVYRVVRRHVVPNTASSIITQLTLLIPGFILFEAQLAYLDLGDSEIPSWGQLIAAGRDHIEFAPWIILAPGFVLFLTILAFNFLGDALLDALNPKADAESEQ
ncbi:ABC transporter permease [Halopiger goleimassiliensis]|uniref:ABC transporter permease n=1 Tax=Halopiger goleimassiliensis TaxID=1293048 RepID=UPI0006776D0E|nr:ABC transporter permease [Halopiger goleimassiliensis]